MKKALIALGFSALLSTAQAAYTESNVTIQIKLHQQQPETENKGVKTQAYKTFTLKTTDVIRILKEEINDPAKQWTKKARLIYVADASGVNFGGYFIREKGMEDHYLGNRFFFFNGIHVNPGGDRRSFVTKGKTVTETSLGTSLVRAFGGVTFRPDDDNKELEISGPFVSNSRYAKAKDSGDIFTIFTMSVTGIGTFDLKKYTSTLPFHGVAEGSFKISPPKILMHPPQPAGN